MSVYLKSIGGVILAVIMCLMLSKQGREVSLILSIAVCSMVAIVAVSYLEPVKEFIETIETSGKLNTEMTGIILKAVGIGLLAQITEMICNDAGNATLGKVLQLLACTVLLCFCVPLLQELMKIADEILGNI